MTATADFYPSPSDRLHVDTRVDRNPLLLSLIHSHERIIGAGVRKQAAGLKLSEQEFHALTRSFRAVLRLSSIYDAETAKWWKPCAADLYGEDLSG